MVGAETSIQLSAEQELPHGVGLTATIATTSATSATTSARTSTTASSRTPTRLSSRMRARTRERPRARPQTAVPLRPVVSKDAAELFRHIDEAVEIRFADANKASGSRSQRRGSAGRRRQQAQAGDSCTSIPKQVVLVDPRQQAPTMATPPLRPQSAMAMRISASATSASPKIFAASHTRPKSASSRNSDVSVFGTFALDIYQERRQTRNRPKSRSPSKR